MGAVNGSNLAALYSHSQYREQRSRRGEAMVVRASEVAVKEESGTPSLGLEVVETLEPNSRVLPVSHCHNILTPIFIFLVSFFEQPSLNQAWRFLELSTPFSQLE